MPAESSALQELKNLINQSSQEIEAIRVSIQESGTLDPLIAAQALRTLHSMKGLANLCQLSQAATIVHAMETVVDQLAKNKLQPDESLVVLLENANNLLFSILQHGQEALGKTIHEILNKLSACSTQQVNQPTPSSPPSPSPSPTTTSGQQALLINPIDFGLIEDDLIQLGETEKLMINQLYDKNRPIIGYLVHCNIQDLQAQVEKIEQTITTNGSLISIVPTNAKQPNYRFAFVFIFTTTLTHQALMQAIVYPGTLTWLEKNKEPQRWQIKEQGLAQQTPVEQAGKKELPPKRPDYDTKQPRGRAGQTTNTPTRTTLTADMLEQMRWEKKEDPLLHIPLSKIDALIDQNNKLISSKIKLQRLCKKLKTRDKQIEEQLFILDKHLKLLQKAILNARMIKTEEVFGSMQRIVKTIADEMEKKIKFQLSGKEIEIDRSILEGLQNPIIHLIKNAADHAIKTPQEREQRGKQAQGLITLSFVQQDDAILVSVTDDGDGLDVKAIKKKAIDMKLLDPIKAASMTDQEIYQYIFIPGFSTKETLTQTSGRGIGMDAVKNTVLQMHGELTLESTPGQGTTFTISIPCNFAVQRLLRFSVDQQHYALPFSHIHEVLVFDQHLMQQADDKLLYIWQSKPIKACSMQLLLHHKQPTDHQADNVIIFKEHHEPTALLVDEIFGQEEIVVRPIESADQKAFELYAGYADFGDDTLVLIINVEKLWELIHNGK